LRQPYLLAHRANLPDKFRQYAELNPRSRNRSTAPNLDARSDQNASPAIESHIKLA